jgi:ABC-type sugar transport system substrate-binding protein
MALNKSGMFKWFTACLVLVLGFAACNRQQPASSGSTEGKRNIKIVYAFANIDENNNRTLNTLRNAFNTINQQRSDIHVECLYTDGQLNVDKQIADIESMIQQKPDLIFISAVDTVGSIPAAQAVHNAGIKVMEDRGMQDDSIDLYFRGMDEYSIQEIVKAWVRQWLDEHPGVKLRAGLIYGNPTHTMQLLRCDAIKDLAQEIPDRLEILDSRYGNWSTDEAMKITEDWLQRYPEMNFISTASDDMALGVANALISAGHDPNNWLIIGIDGTAIGAQLVEEGKITMTVKALMTKIQTECAQVMLDLIEGKIQAKEYNVGRAGLIPMDITNVAEYKNID